MSYNYQSILKIQAECLEEVRAQKNRLTEDEDCNYYDLIENEISYIIYSTIERISLENKKIVISTLKLVKALLYAYACHPELLKSYSNVINLEDKYMFEFPKDEISTEFLKAYCNKDNKEMIELFKKVYN